MYGSEVWGSHQSPDIEQGYLKFLKLILDVKGETPAVAVNGEVGKLHLQRLRQIRFINYWYNLKCSVDFLVFMIYIVDLRKYC